MDKFPQMFNATEVFSIKQYIPPPDIPSVLSQIRSYIVSAVNCGIEKIRDKNGKIVGNEISISYDELIKIGIDLFYCGMITRELKERGFSVQFIVPASYGNYKVPFESLNPNRNERLGAPPKYIVLGIK